ncbi:MAG: sigma-70 family RNA polymerase sigma factor [Chloroflexi bacterium]|nr:sigma-70 family RNA polymerase sigma factor [Chloroflexota bacterium]
MNRVAPNARAQVQGGRVESVCRFLSAEIGLPRRVISAVLADSGLIVTLPDTDGGLPAISPGRGENENIAFSAALRAALDQVAQDRQAENQMLERLRDRVYRIARRVVSTSEHAAVDFVEDLCQDVLLRLWKEDYLRLRRWQGQCTFGRYLTIVVRNAVIDSGRRRVIPGVSLDAHLAEEDTGPTIRDIRDHSPGPEALLLLRTENDSIWREVQRLPARQGELIRRHYFHDQSCTQIAHATGLSPGHAAVILFRARRALKKQLEQGGQDRDQPVMRSTPRQAADAHSQALSRAVMQ